MCGKLCLPHSAETSITDTVRVKVLGLEEIIAAKERLGSEKDIAVLPILRQTARELRRREK